MKFKRSKAHIGKNRRSYQQRMYGLLCFFGVMSLLIIPVFTLHLGSHGDPFQHSLSAIGNLQGMRSVFIAWAIVLCIYFSTMVSTLIILTKNTRARMLRILVLACAFILLICNLIPFPPENTSITLVFKTIWLYFSSFLLAFTLLLLTFTFRNLYPILFRKTLTFILILLSVIIILFISFSFNWITERTNIIGASVFLFTTL